MNITIADIIHFQNFNSMRLIAGKDGLDRIVTKCGILDYEYDSSVKNKFLYKNFEEGQFVLTSFLYAKENEFLIVEALKNLVSRKVSGLAIKNIFHIPLSETFLRFADSKKLPVFLIEDSKLYFEDIIVTVSDSIRNLASIDFGATEADRILNCPLDDLAITQHALQINCSFRQDLLAVYFHQKRAFPSEYYVELLNRYKGSPLYSPSDSIFRYRNGLMLIHSCDTFHYNNIRDLVAEYIHLIAENPIDFFVGVSDLHHSLPDLKKALKESLFAAALHRSESEIYRLYNDLGVYKVLLPFAEDPQMCTFSSQIIDPLMDYDAENKTKLMETAIQFVSCNGNLHKLAQTLSQHENTIRYRLDKIRSVNGLDLRSPEQYEQLSIAVKIHICKNLLHKFHQGAY